MIKTVNNAKRYCCEELSKVENYFIAITSKDIYDIHHRFETHNSNGELLTKQVTRKELIAQNLYFNRPASELIFISHSNHQKLHFSFEDKKNEYSQRLKETNKKISHNKGKHIKVSPERNKKISESVKKIFLEKNIHPNIGTHWYNNGVVSVRANTCPPGFVLGRIKN